MGPWREHGGGCSTKIEVARQSDKHFQDLDREATGILVAIKSAEDEGRTCLRVLKGHNFLPSRLSAKGRTIVKLRAEGWGLIKDSLEILFCACIASYFLPPCLDKLCEQYETLRATLRNCMDRVQEALERTYRLEEKKPPGLMHDPLMHNE